jgi:hypothetical protein
MIANIVDTHRYPLLQTQSPAYRALIDRCQRDLRDTGLCVLEGFVRAEALEKMRQCALAKEPSAYYNPVIGNAYLKDNNPAFPPDHAFNMQEPTTVGVIAYDQIDRHDPLFAIYHAPEVLHFVGEAAGRPEIYHYECPLGKINYSTMRDGDYLRWHFDQSDFVVSIPVQEPEAGGRYEYVRNARTATDEHYDEVGKILRGDRSRVQALNTPPGSLILFEGRYTLHRVTPIAGPRIRVVALLGYADKPGVTSTEYLRRIRYGRVS